MRTVGIKLADGSFYPIMEEGSAQKKKLELTTANDNQTCVMVDLYRSKNCSMEDAEYIDTLKIENLNAHQNGEPSISFDVGLDENGELSASIADPETGATSNSQLTLVSRTAEERLVADDFAVEEPAVEEETSVDEPTVDEPAVDESPAEEPAPEEDSGNGAAVAAGVVAGAGLLAAAGLMAANKDKDEETPADETFEDEAFEEAPVQDEGLASFDAPEEPDADETITDDETTADADETTVDADETIADDDLPDMDFDLSDDATVTDENAFADDATIADDASETADDDSFDLPDDTTIADEPAEVSEASGLMADDDSFDLPDDVTIAEDSTIPGDETILEDESFTTPQELTDNSDEDTDDFFNNLDSETESEATPSPSEGLNFAGLYDKETEMGESAVHEEDDIKKKTRAPVIICIICAIICIVATLLILLVLPGKFNLRQKHADKKAQTAVEKQAETPAKAAAPAEEKKPEVPQAKENEVVVIEKAEEVKPLPPPAAESKNKNVTYKIKWGDTLWDIADTYYKNPWRYKKIASYNGIKNPDHIISGTIITIPAE